MSNIKLQRCASLELKSDTPKGRGVFATEKIPVKTTLDICPVLVLGLEENREHVAKTSLFHYTYNWPVFDSNGDKEVAQAIILGLGSMFNHSTHEQNVVWSRDLDNHLITYWTSRDIEAGEELCISYGSHLTFKDVDAPEPPEPELEIEALTQIQID